MRKAIRSINNAAAAALTVVVNSCINAISLEGDTRETWTRLGKWSEYPGQINLPGGVSRKGLQVLDREGAAIMKKRFYSAVNQIAHLGRGLPIYEGHPDDPVWRKQNPEVRKIAVGRIKDLEIRKDGPWVRCVFNEKGVRLIGGDAPEISAHSPHFGLSIMQGQPNKFRVEELRSIGLTNDPNMPDTAIGLNESTDPEAGEVQPKDKTMKLNTDIMKRLGLNPEASEAATVTAVNTVLTDRDTLTTDLETKKGELTSANEQITDLKADVDKFLGKLVDITLAGAINEGKITEADKPKWEAALKTDFDGESDKLSSLMGTAVNTKDRVGDLGKRKDEGTNTTNGITAINTAVRAYGKEHGLDVDNNSDHFKRAFDAVQEAKPELFAKD